MRLEEVESYDGAEYDAAGFDAFADMVMRGDNFIEQDVNPGSNGGAAPAAAAGQTGGAGGPGGRRPRVHVSRHGSISIQAGSLSTVNALPGLAHAISTHVAHMAHVPWRP